MEVDEDGEGVLVRVRLGVRVFLDRGLLKETLRSLSNGDGFDRVRLSRGSLIALCAHLWLRPQADRVVISLARRRVHLFNRGS